MQNGINFREHWEYYTYFSSYKLNYRMLNRTLYPFNP